MEYVFSVLLGTIAGILIGLLPGVGTSSFLLFISFLILDQSLLFYIIFYSTLASVSQYFGSITTLSFGIPGETTSLPLLSIRDKILQSNRVNEAHFLCAYGSLIASVISLLSMYILIDIFLQSIFYIKTYVILICSGMGIILCILYSNNKKIVSIFLIILGWLSSKIGYDPIYDLTFLTFDNIYLYSGIPILPVLLGIYAIPNMLKASYNLKTLVIENTTTKDRNIQNMLTIRYIFSIIRGTTVGFISGLIPYTGNSLSSYLAFLIEKKFKPNNHMCQATAAESANNAANISVLIPLLLLGIAIVPSEFILLELINSSAKVSPWKTIVENINILAVCILVANIIAFIVSWKCLSNIEFLLSKIKIWLLASIVLLIIISVYLIGYDNGQEMYYLVILSVFTILGILLKTYDLLPFVYAFLLQNNIEQILYRFFKIYL